MHSIYIKYTSHKQVIKSELVGQKNIETKHLSLVKAIILVFKAGAFRY